MQARRLFASLWFVFAVALCLRAALLFGVQNPQEVLGQSPWAWGQEQASLGASLARGEGFADPFGHGTGPSAWLTPLYPGLLAVLFRLFGGVTAEAGLALFLLQGLASAATVLWIDRIGALLGARAAGRVGAWLWALHPIAAWYAVHKVWDTSLVSAGTALCLWWTLRAGRAPSAARAGRLGLAFGTLLLLNPAPASFAPALALYLAPRPFGAETVRRLAAFIGATLAVLAPWSLRNLAVLGSPGLRSNLGVELFVGNNDLARGWHVTEVHPGWAPVETERLRALGEVAYARDAGARAKAWIVAHPRRFAWLVAQKARIFWLGEVPTNDPREFDGVKAADDPKSWVRFVIHCATGIAGVLGLLLIARGRAEGALVRALALGLFPLVYYVTHALERYRFPIDPLLMVGCGACAVLLWRRATRKVE